MKRPPPAALRTPLSYPAFRALWAAGIVTFIGSFVQNVGEAWLMMDMTNSPLPVALLAAAFVGASLFGMLPGGILADRYDRRAVAFWSQILQLLAALGLAALSFTGHITPAALVAGVGLLGLGMALGAPAWSALMPDLVPHELVAEAIALNAVAFNLARAVGPAIGGLVLGRFGATVSFLLNAASFGASMIVLYIYRSREAPPPPSVRPLASALAEPWAVVTGDTEVRRVFVPMFGFTLGAASFYALTPALAKEALHATPFTYGVLLGAMGAGAVLGAVIIKRLRARMTPRVLVTSTMLTFAVFIAIVARVSSAPLAMALLVPAGAGWLGSFSSMQALLQVWAPNQLRARVVALYRMGQLATWTLASVAGGLIANHLGVRAAMGVSAAVCLAGALSTWKLGLPPSFAGGVVPSPPPDLKDP